MGVCMGVAQVDDFNSWARGFVAVFHMGFAGEPFDLLLDTEASAVLGLGQRFNLLVFYACYACCACRRAPTACLSPCPLVIPFPSFPVSRHA